MINAITRRAHAFIHTLSCLGSLWLRELQPQTTLIVVTWDVNDSNWYPVIVASCVWYFFILLYNVKYFFSYMYVQWSYSPFFRYTSKHRQEVKKEYVSNKGDYKTMGQAKVPVPTTDNYLKKHSKEPQLPHSKLRWIILIYFWSLLSNSDWILAYLLVWV